MRGAGGLPQRASELPVKGFYPALHARPTEVQAWLQSYLVTHMERDARQLAAIRDLFGRSNASCRWSQRARASC